MKTIVVWLLDSGPIRLSKIEIFSVSFHLEILKL